MSLLSSIGDIAGGLGGFMAGRKANKPTSEQKAAADLGKWQARTGQQIFDQYNPMGQQVNQALMNPTTDPWFQSIQDWQQGLITSDLLEKLNAAQVSQNRAQAVGGQGWATNPERRDESFLRALAASDVTTHPQAANQAVQYISGLPQTMNTNASTLSSAFGPIQAGQNALTNFGNMNQQNNQRQAGAFGELVNSGVNFFGEAYDAWNGRNKDSSKGWENVPRPMARPQTNAAGVTQQGNF